MQTPEYPSRFCAAPKIHKAGKPPLCSIIDNNNTVFYNITKGLTKIPKSPLNQRYPYSLLKSTAFVEKMEKLRIEEKELMILMDVSAIFIYVPVEKALISSAD